jgi:hypothetical protein
MGHLFHFHHSRLHQDAPAPTQMAKIESEVRQRPWWRQRAVVYVVAIALMLLIALVELARAGGPQYVAGVSYFNAGVTGQPIVWAGGTITYYTDQGNLSPILAGSDADAFVADAFSRWTAIPTAAVSVTRGGQLSEDVNGTNVILNSDRSITLPADIQPSATAKPVAIVYDADGQVTDAFMGIGASADCITNGAFGGPDAFTTDGHFAHALVVLDGNCALTSAALPDLKYRLVRVLGQVFGLGWSQLNLNAITGSPHPTTDDYAGLPLMHAKDLSNCTPISKCPNADQPKLDDAAALSRLYPVTSSNAAQFPGKQVLADTTARIHGSVYFTDAYGNLMQPMQGVNVVARWIDPATGQPSGRYAATSVSGFLFAGNVGNAITGTTDALGQPYDRFGSGDTTLEGFFDLAGLPIPSGNSAQYQISIEAVDPNLSQCVGPYAPWQVKPSGAAQLMVVTVNAGGDFQQDILMNTSMLDLPEASSRDNFASPRLLPRNSDWVGSLSGYGDGDYFLLTGQTGRTLTIEVTALDDNGQPSTQKAQPVIGMWSLAAPVGTPPPAFTPSSFNSPSTGVTTLNAQLLSTTQFRIGIADLRGDGRPDYRYRARVLYGDSVTPNRVSVRAGTPIAIDGTGFRPGLTLTAGNVPLTLLSTSTKEMVATTTAVPDGTVTLTIADPVTGSTATLQSALTFGAGPNDVILLAQGGNPSTPVGGQAPSPIRVAVATPDGVSPVSGATVQWSATNSARLSACNGASTCPALTDESGQAETRVTVGAVGTITITASLAPASYSPPKTVQATVSGTSSAKDLALFAPKVWVAQGATVDVPFTARLLANGAPLSGQTLSWQIGIGSGTLTPASAATDGDGYGRTTLHLNSLAGDVQGTVCLMPGNNPCQTFYVVQVAPSVLKLQPVSGSLQIIRVGQAFQPISLRVTNSATPPNPVMGASVTFQSLIFLPDEDSPVETSGDGGISQHPMKVLLRSSSNAVATDANGLVTLQPSLGGFSRPLEIEIMATTANGASLQYELPVLPALASQTNGSSGVVSLPLPVRPFRSVPKRQTRF